MNYQNMLFQAEIVASPSFVIDLPKLLANLAILAKVQEESGAKILLALKAYAAWATFPFISSTKNGPLLGTCASSVDEARLGYEEFGGEVHAFAAAWTKEEILELLPLIDHITFNSLNQYQQFKDIIINYNTELKKSATSKNTNLKNGKPKQIVMGLRINPEHSEGAVAIYNPCSPTSRLGIRPKQMPATLPDAITGLHWHTLCEQDAEAALRTAKAVEAKFPQLSQCAWLNFGGGHHITREDYNTKLLCELVQRFRQNYHCQVYLEPGEAIALNAGWLVATVLDIVEADLPIAILDVSAACHTPDVMEMPYTPKVIYQNNGQITWAKEATTEAIKDAKQDQYTYRLAGKSCLAGDQFAEYSFKQKLKIGQRLIFADMAIYSMVKTTTFNGLRLPQICLLNETNCQVIKTFGYLNFKNRLS